MEQHEFDVATGLEEEGTAEADGKRGTAHPPRKHLSLQAQGMDKKKRRKKGKGKLTTANGMA